MLCPASEIIRERGLKGTTNLAQFAREAIAQGQGRSETAKNTVKLVQQRSLVKRIERSTLKKRRTRVRSEAG